MVANQAVTYLHNEEEWIRSVLADVKDGKLRQGTVDTWTRCVLVLCARVSLFCWFVYCVLWF